jgi:hypothetical protein
MNLQEIKHVSMKQKLQQYYILCIWKMHQRQIYGNPFTCFDMLPLISFSTLKVTFH